MRSHALAGTSSGLGSSTDRAVAPGRSTHTSQFVARPAPVQLHESAAPAAEPIDAGLVLIGHDVVQRKDAPTTEEDQNGDGVPDVLGTFPGTKVPVRSCMTCRPSGPSASSRWGLPEPLIEQIGGDLPLVDVLPGATTIKLEAGSYGSFSLDSTGKFNLGVKLGDLTASTDGDKTEVGGSIGPVSGKVDSEGTVSGEVELGPFKLGADTTGKVSWGAAGVNMEYDTKTGNISTSFTPELSWGPATFKGTGVDRNTVKLTLELKLELAEGWAIVISQDYLLRKTFTDDEAQRAIIESVVDPFFLKVNGGAGSYSDLLDALGR